MDFNFIELSGKYWKVIERNGQVYCYRLYIDDKKHLDIICDYSNSGDYKYSLYYICNGIRWEVKKESDLYECIMEGNNIADAKINDNIADISIDVEALKKSIEINGYTSKSIIAMEELAELSQVVSKAHRYIDGNEVKVNSDKNLNTYDILDNMSEEIADVLICITNLKIMYNIKNEDVKSWIDYKIRRQKIKDHKIKKRRMAMKRRQLNKEQLVNALIKKATYNDIYEREHGLEEHEYKDDTIKHYFMHKFSKTVIKKFLSDKKIEFVCKPCYESDSDNGSGRYPMLEMVANRGPKGYSLPLLRCVEQVITKDRR